MDIDRLIKQTKKKTDKIVDSKMKKLKTSDDQIKVETDAMHYIDNCNRDHTKIINNMVRGV